MFYDFEIARVAAMGEADIERLVLDAGIIRHRGKIASTINNAHRALAIRAEFGSLAAYIWRFRQNPSTASMAPDASRPKGEACSEPY